MSDLMGRVPVPEIVIAGVFPITSDFPHGAHAPQVVVHRFGSANAKIEHAILNASPFFEIHPPRDRLTAFHRHAYGIAVY